jgi:transcriptional regulator
MYLPKHFREDDLATLLDFMRAHNFATLVTVVDGAPFATHLPLIVQAAGGQVTLLGHVARANPQGQTLAEQREALVIFQGPHAYISPALYEQRQSVPTWNYLAVHAYGPVRLITAPAEAEAVLKQLITRHEPPYHAQWSELPERYRAGMLGGIVAFEMGVTRLEGKFKLSQNRSAGEQRNIIAALEPLGDRDSLELAGWMRRHLSHLEAV